MKHYNDKYKKATELIENNTEDGYIANTDGSTPFYNLHMHLGYWGIRSAQADLVKKFKLSYGTDNFYPYRHTHSTIKFKNSTLKRHFRDHPKVKPILEKEPWAKTFSVEPPVATFIPTEDYCLDNIFFYRYTGKQLKESDIKLLIEGTLPILGTDYNFGQLIAIAANQICEYPFLNEQKYNFLSFGSKKKVCSVGVIAAFTHMRHKLEKQGTVLPRIFSKLNEKKWDKDFVKAFYGQGNAKWPVERTYPVLFAICQTHFDKELELMLHMNKGKILYKRNREV